MLICAVVLLTAALAARADEWNKSFSVSGRPEVVVETDDGNVIVNGGSGQQVAARVTTTGWRISDDDVRVEAHQTGNRVEITVRKAHSFGFSLGNRSIRITIDTPSQSDLALHTKDGNVEISRVLGKQQVRTGDGNVTLRDVEGTVSADTGDGNVTAEGRFDNLNVRTGDGNVSATVRAGSKMSSGWSVHTGDGNIRLELAQNLAATIDAHTGDGKVRSDLSLTVSGNMSESGLRGQLNGGGPTLELRSGDGDIRLTRATGAL